MYTQQELDHLNAEIRTRWIIFALPLAALVAAQIYSLTIRHEILTIVLAVLICFWAIFYIGTQILPRLQYRTHVSSMLHGITHKVKAVFQSFDMDESVVDGVRYRAMNVTCEDERGETYDRLFYWDLEKQLPDYVKGQALEVTFHDREIADIVPA